MTIVRKLLSLLAALLLAAPLAAQAQEPRNFSQAELDQMLAPVALYPDPLLSQVLMAATYPIEVTEAARWTRANPGLTGEAAVRAVEEQDWDPSVKSLVAFPEILQRMDENREWTVALGDAFIGQQAQVMDEVQLLRQRAQAQGNLQSDERIRVDQQGQTIVIQPASPEYVYVPYYDPLVVYGPWWWPAYRPVVWAPWPGYSRPYRTAFWWGRPVGLPFNFFYGNFDWRRRYAHVTHPNAFYYRGPSFRAFAAERGRWQHDPRRRGMERAAIQAQPGFRSAERPQLRQAPQVQQQFQRPVPQFRQERVEQRQPWRQEHRPEFRAAMPAAQVVQSPRFEQRRQEFHAPRQEFRQQRQEQRQEVRQQRQEFRQENRPQRQEARQEHRHRG